MSSLLTQGHTFVSLFSREDEESVCVCVVAVPFLCVCVCVFVCVHKGCAWDSARVSGQCLRGFMEKPAGRCRSFCLCGSEGLHTLMLAHMWPLDVIEHF